MAKTSNSIDIQMAEILKDIGYIKIGMYENKKEHTELFNLVREVQTNFKDEFKNHREECDKKYASKYIEKIALILIGAVVTFIVARFIDLL